VTWPCSFLRDRWCFNLVRALARSPIAVARTVASVATVSSVEAIASVAAVTPAIVTVAITLDAAHHR
jgi:hypothetical protein